MRIFYFKIKTNTTITVEEMQTKFSNNNDNVKQIESMLCIYLAI